MEISFIRLTNFFAMHCDTMRRNPLKNKKKMRISFQPVDNPDKVNTHLLSWLLAACSMIGPFATDMYLPSFHQMAQAFGSDLASVQMTLSSYLAGFAVMTLFYGTISDMFGRKLTMVTGFLCFSASSLGAATSDSLSMLVLWRLCQGIFAGCGMVIGMAIIRDLFGGPKAQMLMAYVSMVFGFGPALAPVIGGVVAPHLSWESHFYILTLISAVLAALCLIFLPETLPQEKRMTPRLGTLLSNYAAAARHSAFMTANTSLAVAFLGQGVFIAGAADWCVEVMHLAPDEFWKLFLPMVSGTVIGSWISARIASRLSTQGTIRVGFSVMFVAGAFALCAMAELLPQGIAWAVMPLMIYTIGIGIVRPGMALISMDFLPNAKGMAASMQSFVQTIFFALCSALLVPLLYGKGALYDLSIAGFGLLTISLWLLAMHLRLENSAQQKR